MNKNILLFISRILCYESNKFFVAEMSKELQDLGYQIEQCEVDMEDEDLEEKLEKYIGKKFRAVIDFNSRLQRLEMDTGERYLDMIDAPFYNYIVDHPLYHHPVIKLKLNRSNIICIDENHCNYVKKYYQDVKNVVFMPLGAMEALNIVPYEERRIDVLFSGTYTSSEELLNQINSDCSCGNTNLLLIEEMKANTSLTQEEALRNILIRSGVTLTNQEFAIRLNSYYLVDKYLRAYYREKVIRVLLDNEINVTVYGYAWDKFECSNKEYLTIHNLVSFPVSLEIEADTKIVLNIMPWFKAGIHDRVLSAMANKAVCVTDSSEYVDKNFVDDKNIVLYSLDHLNELPNKIKNLLQNVDKAKKISECGYEEVIEHHMWKNRVQENIDKII
ncbi:MAG: glycosyltransferase [Lachnotalea sp.]